VKHIRRQSGNALRIGGVGGVHNTDSCMNMIQAGADFVQLLTAIRPSRGKVAATIGQGLIALMDQGGYEDFAAMRAALHKPYR
jgi:dihydroorotate dehydrogenase